MKLLGKKKMRENLLDLELKSFEIGCQKRSVKEKIDKFDPIGYKLLCCKGIVKRTKIQAADWGQSVGVGLRQQDVQTMHPTKD